MSAIQPEFALTRASGGLRPLLRASALAFVAFSLCTSANYLLNDVLDAGSSVYLSLALAYSFALKRTPVLDVLCLGTLCTVRIVAGGAATDIELSRWLLAFSMCLFLSLALSKRYTEPRWLWLLCPMLLFWSLSIWHESSSGRMHDDPVVFALTDLSSWLVAAAGAAVIWLAL